MSSFFNLVGFEYKKIFKRKSAVIALVLGFILMPLGPFSIFWLSSYTSGESESQYEAMVKDREYAMVLSGQAIDEALFREAIEAYAKVPVDDAAHYSVTPEYQRIYRMMYEVFYPEGNEYDLYMNGTLDFKEENFSKFYERRHEYMSAFARSLPISDAAQNKLITLDSEIETPFIFAHTSGFLNLLDDFFMIGVVVAFVLAICFAPMFSGEYSTRTDQLILSAKLGKSKIISAKLFTAISLFIAYFSLISLFSVLATMLIYGLDGANVPYQLIFTFFPYPLTIFEAILIYVICTFFGILLTVSLTLMLSAKFQSPFGVIILISILIFTPMMFYIPDDYLFLHYLYMLFPASMMSSWTVFSRFPYDFFGLIVVPYVFLPVFAFVASLILLPLARRGFRNHQVG